MSIRARLFLILLVATSLVWLGAAALIGHSTRTKVERMLDARLSEAATMVSTLISDRRISLGASAAPVAVAVPGDYRRQLACQVWSLQDDLVGRSSGAPKQRLAQDEGFSLTTLDGEAWRVFTIQNAGLRVSVGDRVAVRDDLVRDVVRGLLVPAAVVLPLLAAIIWISVGRGLAPLRRLEAELLTRSPAESGPLPDHPAPREIQPVRNALNGLFARLQRAREAERDFTAFAAHELKTPLAGLRTQAQVASRTTDAAVRTRALAAIEMSVDRTDRMVRQLLELATVEHDAEPSGGFQPDRLVADVVAELASNASAQGVGIVTRISAMPWLPQGGFLFHAALRNVLENAIAASPHGADVRLTLDSDGKRVLAAVEDSGPGISEAERPKVTQRFYRGVGALPGGSGLGLVIATNAMERLGGTLTLCPSDGRGQRVELALPIA